MQQGQQSSSGTREKSDEDLDLLFKQRGKKVLVTGATGYLASHVVKLLQEEGQNVRGTVRSLQNEDKVQHLYNLCPKATYNLQLVEADLNDPESWELAVSGMTYVIHMASPFPHNNPRREDDVVKPAVEGTLSVLRACVKAGTVKRVVLTSSCAAVDWTSESHDSPRDESSWSDISKQYAVYKSKTMAEKAAWDFMEELPAGQKFELTVINPSVVMGPPLQSSTCTSIELMKKLLERQISSLPKINLPLVDVRDVAAAHVRAMTLPEAAGKRHICNTTNMWYTDIALLMKAVFEPQGYNVPTAEGSKFMLKISSIFNSSLKPLLPEIGVVRLFDNKRMRQVLQIQPREIRDTLVEMAYSLIEAGFVRKTSQYRGPGGTEEREMYMSLALS